MTRENTALAWVEKEFSEGFLGRLRSFLEKPLTSSAADAIEWVREQPSPSFVGGGTELPTDQLVGEAPQPKPPLKEVLPKVGEWLRRPLSWREELAQIGSVVKGLGEMLIAGPRQLGEAAEGKPVEMKAATEGALLGFLGPGGGGVANIGRGAAKKQVLKMWKAGKLELPAAKAAMEGLDLLPQELLDPVTALNFRKDVPGAFMVHAAPKSVAAAKGYSKIGFTPAVNVDPSHIPWSLAHETGHSWILDYINRVGGKEGKELSNILASQREGYKEIWKGLKEGKLEDVKNLHAGLPGEATSNLLADQLLKGNKVDEEKLVEAFKGFYERAKSRGILREGDAEAATTLATWDKAKGLLEGASKGKGGEQLKELFAEVEGTSTREIARGLEKEFGLAERTLLREGDAKVGAILWETIIKDILSSQHSYDKLFKKNILAGEPIALGKGNISDVPEAFAVLTKAGAKGKTLGEKLENAALDKTVQGNLTRLGYPNPKHFNIVENKPAPNREDFLSTLLREGGTKVPWAYSLLGKTLEKPEFLAAKEMKGSTLINKLKKAGVSDAELEWTGIKGQLEKAGSSPVDMEMVRKTVKEEGIKVEAKVAKKGDLGDLMDEMAGGEEGLNPRHQQHFVGKPLPKGEGYRESLLILEPKAGTGTFQKPDHYDPDNVAVGMIADLRKTSEGSSALHIHEGQSDWAQRARGGTYDPEKAAFYNKALEKMEGLYEKILQKPFRKSLEGKSGEMGLIAARGIHSKIERGAKLLESRSMALEGSPPPLPFTTDKAMELGVKRMLWEAAEEGVDKVTWSTGKDVAERWSLRQVADELNYNAGTGELKVFTPEGGLHRIPVKKEDLGQYVDKEVVSVLLEKGGISREEIANLEIGKRWPYEVYDKKFQGWMKKAVNEVGGEAKIGEAKIAEHELTESWRQELLRRKSKYQQMLEDPKNAVSPSMLKEELRVIEKQLAPFEEGHPVHSLDLPESLRLRIKSKGFKLGKRIATQALEGIA